MDEKQKYRVSKLIFACLFVYGMLLLVNQLYYKIPPVCNYEEGLFAKIVTIVFITLLNIGFILAVGSCGWILCNKIIDRYDIRNLFFITILTLISFVIAYIVCIIALPVVFFLIRLLLGVTDIISGINSIFDPRWIDPPVDYFNLLNV